MKKPEFFDYDKYLYSKGKPSKDTLSDIDEDKNQKSNKSQRKKTEKNDTVESIKNALGDALDEDITEIAELSVNANIEDETPVKKQSLKRSLYFVIGIAVSFMSLIGFISTIVFCANIITRVADNTKQKEEFVQIIYPAVIVDPPVFEKASQLSSDTVISAAIWDIILHEDTSKYPEEFGNITIPQLDVELHATSLFGSGLTFEHKTLGDATLSFYYSEDTKSYNIPISPKYFPYSPQIEDIQRSGNTYTLKVGYISPSPAWLINTQDSEIKPDKYMEYILEKTNNSYTITAINEVKGQNNNNNGL